MDILFITHDFDAGGAARSLLMLAPHLKGFGHRVTIASLPKPRHELEPWNTYLNLGIDVHHLPFPWISLEYVGATVPNPNYPPHVRHLHSESLQKLKEFTPDVVCFNGYPSTSLAPYFKAARKILIAREVLKTETPLFRQSIRLLQRNIHKAIAIGPIELKQLDEIGLQAELVFNSAKNTPSFIHPETIPPIQFGCFGKIYEDKGQDVLVMACSAIKNYLRSAHAKIHVFGNADETYLSALNTIIHHNGIQDLIKFHGWTADVENHMKKMHCVIRPDKTGSPWGRDIIEAMSIGRPVLATGTETIFVKDDRTGWLVSPNDPEQLALKMLEICRAPQKLFDVGKTAFNFASEHFDPETNARHIESILKATS